MMHTVFGTVTALVTEQLRHQLQYRKGNARYERLASHSRNINRN
jgi:hypothetical protein